jgi:2,4-dienoyl-CoA reductase-like NADH-dependent reductase (Old Yellow Enzyme family)/thioredoxin reductase
MSNSGLDCLFEPLNMPNMKLKNRFFMAPIGTGFSIEQMTPFLAARAKGGTALITTGETSVHPGGRAGIKNETVLENDNDIAQLSKLAKAVKSDGAKIVLQLNHAGRYSFGGRVGGQAVAPSAVMSGYTGETPRELSTGEADDLVIAFARAALRAREAGFDGVEFLGSSGYLISEFLSPLTNKRTDKYGGDAVGRAAFIISILKEARKLVGSDFNLCVKFDADDGMKGGVTLTESRQFAPALATAGADRLHVWAGWHEATRPMLPMSVPAGAFVYLAEEIKKTVSVPVSTVGRINYPELAAEIIAKGQADLVGLARGLMADPDFVNKTRDGRVKEIRRCTACCHCFDDLLAGLKSGGEVNLSCAVNPELGKESENLIKKSDKPKHVVVIGAGPAGLEVSRVASMRGHKVTIYEKDAKIGGMVNLSFVPPHKEELKSIIDYYSYQIKLNNLNVKLSKEFDTVEMEKIKPDVVVLASGAKIISSKITCTSKTCVFTASDVLEGKADTGDMVVVIGGGMVGLETAEYLADKGKKVTVIEMDKIASDMGSTVRWEFISRIRRKISILSSTRVLEIREKGVLVLDKDNNEKEIHADTVVLAAGMESVRDLANDIAIKGVEYYLVGSCKEPGQIDEAIKDGFNVGCAI